MHPLAFVSRVGTVALMMPSSNAPGQSKRTAGLAKRPARSGANPYSGFAIDRERRLALLSRDLRLVLIAAICVFGGHAAVPSVVERLITLAVSK